MKKLKRILAICLMVFYVCVLSACGKNNSNMNNNDMADQTQSTENNNAGNTGNRCHKACRERQQCK